MRLYGKRFLRNSIQNQVEGRTETRDAVVIAVYPLTRKAEVMIQGTTKMIVVKYPDNWEATPVWLKPGNSVRLVHRSGIRTRLEIVGHGQVRPSTAIGTIPEPSQNDGIISGCEVIPFATPTMAVIVLSGTFRIDGDIYTLGNNQLYAMQTGSTLYMGSGVPMGSSDYPYLLTIADAPGSGFRYDIVVVGTDGVPHVITGTSALSDPQLPDIPADHIMLEKILICDITSCITNTECGRTYTNPVPTGIDVSVTNEYDSTNRMPWGDYRHGTIAEIAVTIIDQYNRPCTDYAGGWVVKAENMITTQEGLEKQNPGNRYGQLWSQDDGWNPFAVKQTLSSVQYGYTFKYKRNKIPKSPDFWSGIIYTVGRTDNGTATASYGDSPWTQWKGEIAAITANEDIAYYAAFSQLGGRIPELGDSYQIPAEPLSPAYSGVCSGFDSSDSENYDRCTALKISVENDVYKFQNIKTILVEDPSGNIPGGT